MNLMKSTLIALLATSALSTVTAAENIVTGQVLLDSGAVKVPAEEMKSIVRPGVEVETYAPGTGSYRLWTNDASGKFIASRRGGTTDARSQGSGEWRVTDQGEYCVQIEWRTARMSPDYTERWCRAIYRHDGALYLAPGDLAGKGEAKYSKVQFK